MKIYRIANRRHAKNITGAGASFYPGRWNNIGTPVLYTGESIEIALLEILVHIPALLVPELDVLILEIPENSIKEIKINDLPSNWNQFPAPTILSEVGQQWVENNQSLAMKVPSSIIESAFIFVLNCDHKRYSEVKIIDHHKFSFDSRLRKS
ncbi:RES domain-containing protein [Cryomorpha ignava]|uniref:RES domain-containing protein n=1 Tax=Cryomorpha ignava TaxID=101383 RepID=A0A7K3WPW5_9FLAO|nr:RES domain-containing protein [Cryomorpha ignava]NEN23700.1 RES domain-containing protein [Cryomorpha ignava]